jgi:hypothetical protein
MLAPTRRPECLDQQHLQQPPKHHFAGSPVSSSLVDDHTDKKRQPLLTTNMNDFRQQADEQSFVI